MTMKNSRNVTPGAPSPNDRPAQRLRQGRGGGHESKNQKKRGGRSEDMVSSTQDDPKQAPIEGVVLTEAEVEEFAAECLQSNKEKEGANETGNSEVSQGKDEEKEKE